MQKRTEIRDGKQFTVTVLDDREQIAFTCFACKRTLPHENLSRSEPHKHGRTSWFLCKDCDWKLTRRTPKEQDADMSRFHNTKYPFAATINGEPVTVWPDWIEHEEADA